MSPKVSKLIKPFVLLMLFTVVWLPLSGTGCGKPEARIDLEGFKEYARGFNLADRSNRLFLIDGELVLWAWTGSAADYGYGTFLYRQTRDNVLCSVSDSIAGPRFTYNDESYRAMFEVIIKNLDREDLGLGPSHTVEQIPL